MIRSLHTATGVGGDRLLRDLERTFGNDLDFRHLLPPLVTGQ